MTLAEQCNGNCRLCIGFRLYLLVIGILLWIPGIIFTFKTSWREELNIQLWGTTVMLVLGCFLIMLGVIGWILYLWEVQADRRKYSMERQSRRLARRRRRHEARMVRHQSGDVIWTVNGASPETVTANDLQPRNGSTTSIQVHWSEEFPSNNTLTTLDVDYASELGAGSEIDQKSIQSEKLSSYQPSEVSSAHAVHSDVDSQTSRNNDVSHNNVAEDVVNIDEVAWPLDDVISEHYDSEEMADVIEITHL